MAAWLWIVLIVCVVVGFLFGEESGRDEGRREERERWERRSGKGRR